MSSKTNEPLIAIADDSNTTPESNDGDSFLNNGKEEKEEEEVDDNEEKISESKSDDVFVEDEEEKTTEKSPLMQNFQSESDFLSRIANFKSPEKKDRSQMTMKEKIAAEGQLGKLYFAQTWNQIKKGKVNFCLGCSAVFIVVVVVGVLLSVLSNAPVFFLRLAELQTGEVDIRFQMDREESSINYTLVNQIISNVTIDGESISKYSTPRLSGNIAVFSPDACFDLVNITGNIDYENNPDIDSTFCIGGRRAWLWVTDTEKEREIGIGRNWDKPKLGKGEIYLDSNLASALRLGKNSYAVINLPSGYFRGIWQRLLPYPESAKQSIFLTVLVKDTFSGGGGKIASDFTRGVFMEFDTFTEFLSEQISGVTDEIRDDVKSIDLNQYSGQVLFNIPSKERLKYYINSNFDSIQKKLTSTVSLLAYDMGFPGLGLSLPVLTGLQKYRNMSLFLGVIINVIIFILLFICCVLIFSLLIVNVETRTFEIGMMKMFGMKSYQVICLLLVQAVTYTLFSFPLGLIAAQGILAWVFSELGKLINVKVDPALSGMAVGIAALLGFSVPIISAVLPIKNAMGVHLYDALNVRRATSAVKISLERSEDQRFSPAVVITGVAMTIFGLGVYYVMPLSLLSSNIQLLLNLFTFLLIAMLVGMTLLTLNLQYLLEKFLVYFLFWFDRASIRSMILKNLVAHRERNMKTTLLYAVSLGFIVFISVSYSIQAVSIVYEDEQQAGSLMRVSAEMGDYRLARIRGYEEFAENSPFVEGYTWITQPLQSFPNVSDVSVSNLGHVFSASTRVYAVSPNYFDVALSQFLRVDTFDSTKYDGLSLSEALYTARGSHSMIAGTYYKTSIGLQEDKHFLLDISYLETDNGSIPSPNRISLTPMAFLNGAPGFQFSPFPQVYSQDAIISIPSLLKFSQRNISIYQLPLQHFLIKFKDNATDADKDAVRAGLEEVASMEDYAEIYDARDRGNTLDTANNILSYFFNFTTAIAMIVCFFSLKSSMFNSIYSQSKEISILRAMGVSKFWLYRVYIYEAFIIVLSSSLLGIMIGTFVGYTMVIQRALFTQLPLPFVFPTNILIVVAVSSLVLGFIASFGPIRFLLRMSTVELMRFYY